MNKKIKLFSALYFYPSCYSHVLSTHLPAILALLQQVTLLSLLNNMALPSSLFTLGHKAILSLLITMILKQFYLMPKRTCHGNQ